MEKVLYRCPNCGSDIEYIETYHSEYHYKLARNGSIHKVPKKKRDLGKLPNTKVSCVNKNCDFLIILEDGKEGNYKDIKLRYNLRKLRSIVEEK